MRCPVRSVVLICAHAQMTPITSHQCLPLVGCYPQVPHGAAGFFLLGRICRLTTRHAEAAEHFYTALKLNPLLWSAYEELCQLGACPLLWLIV